MLKKLKNATVFFVVLLAVFSCIYMLMGDFATKKASQAEPDNISGQPGNESLPGEEAELKGDEQDVRALVEAFGKALKMVSLSAPEDIAAAGIKENYAGYITPGLLQKWLADPQSAPGRVVSSPWPERIDILGLKKGDENQYTVYGEIIEVTSVELANGGIAAKRPVVIEVQKEGKGWLISNVTMGEYFPGDSIVYENSRYGFRFYLPKSWEGYSVIEEQWQGTGIGTGELVETGPRLLIRHPEWSQEEPRQDIPILVFTHEQWDAVQKESFSIGAAPVGPSRLASNSRYVFALPARYNFAFPKGYEEVQEILEGNPIWPFEK